jgi:hypothetical protein
VYDVSALAANLLRRPLHRHRVALVAACRRWAREERPANVQIACFHPADPWTIAASARKST